MLTPSPCPFRNIHLISVQGVYEHLQQRDRGLLHVLCEGFHLQEDSQERGKGNISYYLSVDKRKKKASINNHKFSTKKENPEFIIG